MEYFWRLILPLIHTCYTSNILSCILKENVQKQTRLIFRLFSYSCGGKLIHLRKNMKYTLNLSINETLKVTRVLCFLISRVID